MSVVNAIPMLLADEGYQISRSVRLRSSASAYFNRTLTTPTSGTTWTWSAWVKRGALSVESQLFSAGAAVSDQVFFQNSTDVLIVYLGANTLVTSQVFRDPSSWYHIVLQVDTTQATASNRVRLYVNGVQVTAFSSTSYPTQNATTKFNSASAHNIGRYQAGASGYFDGYLTEINFIDGQALTPSSFGETDVLTGVWKPKKYTGTYGTNGFFLNFSDPSAASASAIGKDYSGNGNNWTPNNISVTSGSTYDSMLDVPTLWADGGNGRGNYATLNPIQNPPSGAVSTAYSNGNLQTVLDSSVARSTFAPASGKWYAEFVITSATLSTDTRFAVEPSSGNTFSGNAGQGRAYSANGNKVFNGTSTAYGSTWTQNDIIGCALDLDNGKVWWSKNGTWQASGDPAAGTNEAFSGLSGDFNFTIVNGNSAVSKTFVANFGQRPFAYTPPTGFKALNTQNLPEPVIKKGNQWFDTLLWTSTATVKDVTGSSFQPDLVWVKSRASGNPNEGYHHLVDAVRGTGRVLSSNLTDAEYWTGTNNSVQAFLSNGFTAGDADGLNGEAMVSWLWKEGATPGFDIVTYTGNGTGGRTISHSLGVTPKLYILKRRDAGGYNWIVQTTIIDGSLDYLFLNTTAAKGDSGDTPPTSSVFSVSGNADVNANGGTYVAYFFAEVAGFSKFGSYTGNGSSDGPFVFCGFRPRWLMYKRTDSTGQWNIIDTARNPSNQLDTLLRANLSNADETNAVYAQDFTANGWKIRSTNVDINVNGATYIFMAFAENPFKNALAR